MFTKYHLPVTFGQNWPTMQRSLSAIAELLVSFRTVKRWGLGMGLHTLLRRFIFQCIWCIMCVTAWCSARKLSKFVWYTNAGGGAPTIFSRINPAYVYNPHTPIPHTKSHFQWKKICTVCSHAPSYTTHCSCEMRVTLSARPTELTRVWNLTIMQHVPHCCARPLYLVTLTCIVNVAELLACVLLGQVTIT